MDNPDAWVKHVHFHPNTVIVLDSPLSLCVRHALNSHLNSFSRESAHLSLFIYSIIVKLWLCVCGFHIDIQNS